MDRLAMGRARMAKEPRDMLTTSYDTAAAALRADLAIAARCNVSPSSAALRCLSVMDRVSRAQDHAAMAALTARGALRLAA